MAMKWKSFSRLQAHLVPLLVALVTLQSASLVTGQPQPQQQCTASSTTVILPFLNFSSSATSATGSLPTAGTCNTWSLDVSRATCGSANSTLLLEFWLTQPGTLTPLDRRRVVDGVYFLSSQLFSSQTSPPVVSRTAAGAINFSPLPFDGPNNPDLVGLYLDIDSTNNRRPYQRFTIPVGRRFDFSVASSQTWFLTLANMNNNVGAGTIDYAFRATCMLSNELPCARTAPDSGSCNTPWPATTSGVCQVDKTCTCSAGQADIACGTPVADVTNLASSNLFREQSVAPYSWSYYSVTLPANADARVLAEVLKPPLSARTYYLALRVRQVLPGHVHLDPSMFSLTDSCVCNTCDCYVPQQSQSLLYEMQVVPNGAPTTWYIGVYCQPRTASTASSISPASPPSYKIRVRSQLDGSPLCPMDCSGNGVCSVPKVATQGTYTCTCNPPSGGNPGWGGPYCQGRLQTVRVSDNSPNFDSGSVPIVPGQWLFYTVNVLTSNALSLSWFADQSPSPNLVFAFSPLYSMSVGEMYFIPGTTWVFTSNTPTMQLPLSNAPNTWVLGIYNSDQQTNTSSSFSFVINSPTRSTSFMSTLQLALIGAASGLIMLTLAFMTVRVILLRRSAVRTFPDGIPAHATGFEGAPHPERPQPVGVPPEVVATFPLFKYSAVTFEEMRKQNSLRRTAAANAAASAAAAATAANAANAGTGTGAGAGACSADATARPVGGAAATGSGSLGSSPVSPGAGGGSGPLQRQQSHSGHTSDAEQGTPHAHDDAGDGDDDGPTCSVCICGFEEGEVLRRLPCQHVFHQACIDAWMQQHSTCPNCRWALCPDAPQQYDRRNRRRGRGLPESSAPSQQQPTHIRGTDPRASHPEETQSPTRYPFPSATPPPPSLSMPPSRGQAMLSPPAGPGPRAGAGAEPGPGAGPAAGQPRSPVRMHNNSVYANWTGGGSPPRQGATLDSHGGSGGGAAGAAGGAGGVGGDGSFMAPGSATGTTPPLSPALDSPRSVVAVGRPAAQASGGSMEGRPSSVEMASSGRQPRSRGGTAPAASPVPDVDQ